MNDADHIAQMHKFLDELWILYSPNSALRLRILAAKAGRWEWARLTTDEELDVLLAGEYNGNSGLLLEAPSATATGRSSGDRS